MNSSWIGGAVAASTALPSFEARSLSRREYEAHGPSLVHDRVFPWPCTRPEALQDVLVRRARAAGAPLAMDDPRFRRYFEMLKHGVPRDAVAQTMAMDGLATHQRLLADPFSTTAPDTAVCAQAG